MKITFGEGTTENVFIIRSGYSSRILEMSRVPIPDPVPPPKEWASWNPCRRKINKVSIKYSRNKSQSIPEDSRSFQLLYAPHLGQNQPTQHLQCSDPLPSCCQLHFDRIQNCQVGKFFHKVQNGLSPWYQVPSQPRQHEEHTFHLKKKSN